MTRLFLNTAILFLAVAALGAVNTTTPGEVRLSATFECVSIRARYTNDDNANNSMTIQYRQTGGGAWSTAYAPIVDRRATVVVLTTTNDNAANQFEARGSIVRLTPNTSYDIKTTWSDADGVTGDASATNTVTTLSYSPPTGATTRYIDAAASSEGIGTQGDPFKTITNAIVNSTQGDVLVVAPGRYDSPIITSNGLASAYYVLRTNGAGQCSIKAGNSNSITVAGNYWVIDGFNLEQSLRGGIRINPNVHHVFVMNTLQTNAVSDATETIACGAAELGRDVNYNIYLLTNTWTTYNTTITNANNGWVDNIDLGGGPLSNCVVADNVLVGGWDGIGNRLNSGFNGNGENCDIARNVITNAIDDAIEYDGMGPNLRVYSNRIWKRQIGASNYGGSLLSDCGTYIGPTYIFRNTAMADQRTNGVGLGLKMGSHSSVGWSFYFHNVLITTNGNNNETVSEGQDSSNKVYRCNIMWSTGNVWYQGASHNSRDYDLGYNPGKNYALNWNGSTTYAALTNFQSGTGQEANGLSANPIFGPNYTITSSSPAHNAGVVLANFNDGYSGTAPDIGAFELGEFKTTIHGKAHLGGKSGQ